MSQHHKWGKLSDCPALYYCLCRGVLNFSESPVTDAAMIQHDTLEYCKCKYKSKYLKAIYNPGPLFTLFAWTIRKQNRPCNFPWVYWWYKAIHSYLRCTAKYHGWPKKPIPESNVDLVFIEISNLFLRCGASVAIFNQDTGDLFPMGTGVVSSPQLCQSMLNQLICRGMVIVTL